MAAPWQKGGRSYGKYLDGLTLRQRELVKLYLADARRGNHRGDRHRDDSAMSDWWVYRIPSTKNPPTTLRLHKRDNQGRIVQVISITENGVTK